MTSLADNKDFFESTRKLLLEKKRAKEKQAKGAAGSETPERIRAPPVVLLSLIHI